MCVHVFGAKEEILNCVIDWEHSHEWLVYKKFYRTSFDPFHFKQRNRLNEEETPFAKRLSDNAKIAHVRVNEREREQVGE